MKRIHIVGAPRSGTTLMLELLVNGFGIDAYATDEHSALWLPRRDAAILCTKKPGDTHLVGPLLDADPDQWFVFMLRDPRDVVVSRHGLAPDRFFANLAQWRRAWREVEPWRAHQRLVIVRYERLVREPDAIQREIARRMPFLTFRAPFSAYHLSSRPSQQSLVAMRALRPVDDASVGAWRREKARLAGQVRIHGDLAAELIALGYERDARWLEELNGAEPDTAPGFWPEQPTPEFAARRRAEATEGVAQYLARRQAGREARRVDFCWELGGHTGHVTTLMPVARALRERGRPVRFLLRDPRTGTDLAGMADLPREPAPHWAGPERFESPLNFGEILINFGYDDPVMLRRLIEAWRAQLADTALVVANVAPAAHIAARTLGIPSLEISQGFHMPPPAFPAPPLRDWEPAPRARLESADRRVLDAINGVLAAYDVPPLAAIGELFAGRGMLLTYPELDIYPERGPAEYFGVPVSGEGRAQPAWPAGRGPRVFSYLYAYCPGLERLLEALGQLDCPTLMLCRGIDEALRSRHAAGPVHLAAEPMAASALIAEADLVICHGSHQMTAQALLAGKPILAMPTQLEQFLTTRRVVRMGAGLGILPEAPDPDFAAALAELSRNPAYAARAREFAQRYASHDRSAALAAMIERCEAALARART